MEYIEKCVQDLAPGDYVVNIGTLERTTRRMSHGISNYYWLNFSPPTFNHGANPTKKLLCLKNPPKRVVTQGENIGGVTID
jgi:hypothetical protein